MPASKKSSAAKKGTVSPRKTRRESSWCPCLQRGANGRATHTRGEMTVFHSGTSAVVSCANHVNNYLLGGFRLIGYVRRKATPKPAPTGGKK